MENFYNDLEGLRIAIEIEKRGYEFYRQAFETSIEENLRKILSDLMNEEAEHEASFRQVFEKVNEAKEAHSDEYLFDPDVSRYLTVLAEFHIFPAVEQITQKLAELKTPLAILKTALQAEKDSVLFYDELAANAKFPAAKSVFEMLKAEERKHVVRISQMIRRLI